MLKHDNSTTDFKIHIKIPRSSKFNNIVFYFSDTGTTPPESCVFGQLLNIGAVLGKYLIRDVIIYHIHFERETRFGKLHDLIYRPQQRINVKNTEGAIKNEQSRDTGNICYTRRRQTKTKTQHNIYRKYLSVTSVMDVHNNQNECENNS